MQKFKRLISIILVVVLLFPMLPMPAQATVNQDPAILDPGEVTFDSSNDLGTLLTNEITQYQDETAKEQEEYDGGYGISSVTINSTTATVTYDSMEEAILVVALYSEDSNQLLTSAKTNVSAEQAEATVTFTGEIPQFFTLTAFLLDLYDHSPLCPSYVSPMYTRDMQELLAMSATDAVEEYGEDRVYQLDESENTNFAVYAEDTVVIEESATANNLVSADEEALTYHFSNADDILKTLAIGTVVVYSDLAGELFIFKVDSLSTDGTDVTIVGTDVELDDVFSLMKLESAGDTKDAVLDTSDTSSCLIYEDNSVARSGSVSTYAWEGNLSGKEAFTFTLHEDELKKTYSSHISGNFKEDVTLTFFFESAMSFYISTKRQYLQFTITPGVELTGTVSGTLNMVGDGLNVGRIDIPLGTGVYAHLKPALKFSFSAQASLFLKASFTLGASAEHRSGGHFIGKNLSTKPKVESSLEFEGMVFFGIALNASVTVLSDKVAKAALKDTVGITITGKLEKKLTEQDEPSGSIYHSCKNCVDGDISLVFKLTLEIQFLKLDALKWERTLVNFSLKLFDFYWSLDHNEFGFNNCPHYMYHVKFHAMDENEVDAKDIQVFIATAVGSGSVGIDTYDMGITNANGLLEGNYLREGYYTFKANINGQTVVTERTRIYSPTKVVLTASQEYWNRRNALKKLMIHPDDATQSSEKDKGTCGDAVNWILFSNNLLLITGEGAMDSYSNASQAPWYKYQSQITGVQICEGVSSVGAYAFSGCTSLKKVIIEDTVTNLGNSAFSGCSSLNQIRLPVDISYSSYYLNETSSPFYNCSSVSQIHYTYGQTGVMPNKHYSSSSSANNRYWPYTLEGICSDSLKHVYLEEGITSIGNYAFYNCCNLTTVAIPTTLTTIGSYAFYSCGTLSGVELPEGLTYLGSYAFSECSNITEIQFPSTLTEIPRECFRGCIGLSKLVIPDNITSLGSAAFAGCKNITSVTIPVDISYSSYYLNETSSTFYNCSSVSQIHYTYGQTGVMPNKHYSPSSSANNRYWPYTLEGICSDSLKCVYLEEGITSIGNYAFYNCCNLTTVAIPATLTTIGSYAFYSCGTLSGVELPEGLTYLGSYAFSECSNITEIQFPSTLTEIPRECFRGCIGLSKLVIPDNITSLGSAAFAGCKNITSVTIPVDISYSSYYLNETSSTFYNCSSVSQIHYTYGQTGVMPNKHYSPSSSANNRYWPYTLEGICSDSLKCVYLEEGITSIGNYAFYNCCNLTTVAIPATLTTIGSYAFYSCGTLSGVELPEGLTYLGSYAFSECSNITEIQFPSTLTEIPRECFRGCIGLSKLVIPDNITSLGSAAFAGCKNITSVTIPVDISYSSYYLNETSSTFYNCSSVSQIHYTYGQTGVMPNKHYSSSSSANNRYWPYTLEGICSDSLKRVYLEEDITQIGSYGFYNCTMLNTVVFCGNAPTIATNSFYGVTANAYYPIGNKSWSQDILQGYGGILAWSSYELDTFSEMISVSAEVTLGGTQESIPSLEEIVSVSVPVVAEPSPTVLDSPVVPNDLVLDLTNNTALNAVFPGENTTHIVEDFLLETSSFSNLVPGREYVMLALVSLDAEDLLAEENLLFIEQAQADENGKLSFTYRLKAPTENFYLVACGASNRNMSEAVITFPEMAFTGESAFIKPTVVYNGETLVEFVDYIIVDGTSYSSAGTFNCTIRGIYNYTGLAKYTYQIAESSGIVLGGPVSKDIPYSANGQTITIISDKPYCFGYLNETEQKYTMITVVDNNDGSFSFTAPAGVTEILVVIMGDTNGDGNVTAPDIARLNAHLKANGTQSVMTAEELFAADVNGDNLLDDADIITLSSAILGMRPLT